MLKISIPCVVIITLCSLRQGDANKECYNCIGKKGGAAIDYCYRSGGVSSEPTTPCRGQCAKFSFWVNDREEGYVRRVCADSYMTCEEIGEPVMRMADELPVSKIERFSFKYKCDYCNMTLCNNANIAYQTFLSLVVMCIMAKIVS